MVEQKGLYWLCDGSGKIGVVGMMWVLKLGHRAVKGMDRESNAHCGELKIRLQTVPGQGLTWAG